MRRGVRIFSIAGAIWRRCGWSLAVLAVLILGAWPAHGATPPPEENRVALLIGNSGYSVGPLRNPVNDARLMEIVLKEAGFKVFRAENVGRREMHRLIRAFGDLLKRDGGVGLFYFSGHGLQIKGVNYLVPIDADIRSEDEVAADSIDAQLVLDKMESAGNRMNLLVLDACRSNPFQSSSRSLNRGLAQMNAPSGTLVAYATSPGNVALDGAGSNSPYTRHLASAIRQRGLPVEEVFKQVRSAVRRDTNNAQTPWENTALEGQFYFLPPVQQAEPATPMVNPADIALWDTIKNSRSAADYAVYLEQFPSGAFAALARSRQRELREAAPSVAAPAVAPPAPSQPAAPAVAAITAPALPAQAEAAPQAAAGAQGLSVVGGELLITDLAYRKSERLAVNGERMADGSLRFSSGDQISADGRVAAVRLGATVLRVVEGGWRLPLTQGLEGQARLADVGADIEFRVQWRTLAGPAGLTQLVMRIAEYRPQRHNSATRQGEWTGLFGANSVLPVKTSLTLKSQVTGMSSAPDLFETEFTPAQAGVQTAAAGQMEGVVIVRDRMSNQKTDHPFSIPGAPGQRLEFGTGDVVDADGRVLAVRLGPYVFATREGSLWTVPPRPGASGTARGADPAQPDFPMSIRWSTASREGQTTVVEASIDMYNSQAINMIARRGTWSAQYAAQHKLPARFTLQIRPAMSIASSGGPEAYEGETEWRASGASASAPTHLILRDELSRTSESIALLRRQEADGSISFGSGDMVSATGQVISARIGSAVVRVTQGQLWTFPLRVGDQGEATVTIPGVATPGIVNWVVRADKDPVVRVEARVQLPIVGLTAQSMRSGPWTARFLPNVPVAIETRLEARPNFAGGGMVPEMFTTSLGQDQARQFAFERR